MQKNLPTAFINDLIEAICLYEYKLILMSAELIMYSCLWDKTRTRHIEVHL